MGNCYAAMHQMGMLDGSQREGFLAGQTYISYFQMESVLLEYPRIMEAGVISSCDAAQNQKLRIYIALEDDFENDRELEVFCQEVSEFLRREFALACPLHVEVRDKLPMTRSGKILRTVLREWN